MNLAELRKRLIDEGVMGSAYCLEGGLPGDCYTVGRESDGRWSVYYSERGERHSVKYHDKEDDAAADLLDRIMRDPSTRNRQ